MLIHQCERIKAIMQKNTPTSEPRRWELVEVPVFLGAPDEILEDLALRQVTGLG